MRRYPQAVFIVLEEAAIARSQMRQRAALVARKGSFRSVNWWGTGTEYGVGAKLVKDG